MCSFVPQHDRLQSSLIQAIFFRQSLSELKKKHCGCVGNSICLQYSRRRSPQERLCMSASVPRRSYLSVPTARSRTNEKMSFMDESSTNVWSAKLIYCTCG